MKFLVAYDGSRQSRKALDEAVGLASKVGGEIVLLSVTETICPLGSSESLTKEDCTKMDEALKKETEGILNSVKQDLEKKAMKVKTVTRKGGPADMILDVCEKEGCDLIVIGSHGRHGAKKFFLGSVSTRVAERAPCSVLIAR
jgi:nucleotide-binding universal stress UspA family protein